MGAYRESVAMPLVSSFFTSPWRSSRINSIRWPMLRRVGLSKARNCWRAFSVMKSR